MTRFRISAHNLAIERGRYTRPKPTPVEKRLCPYCPSAIQDEKHFLTTCTRYHTERQHMYDEINKLCINFKSLTDDEKFSFLMISEGSICREVAQFIATHLT